MTLHVLFVCVSFVKLSMCVCYSAIYIYIFFFFLPKLLENIFLVGCAKNRFTFLYISKVQIEGSMFVI
jgi:hypothetical protein